MPTLHFSTFHWPSYFQSYFQTYFSTHRIASVLLIIGAGLLAFEPALWLITTWLDPVYDSLGLVVIALMTGLWLWSVRSPRIAVPRPALALVLLMSTALIRLSAQILAIHTLAAMTLVLDVYALARLSGVEERRRAVSALGLAVLFAFTLPMERVIQRLIGYPLQQIAASGAATLLSSVIPDVQQHGINLVIAGQPVLVDLPCSGARSLLLLMLLFTVIVTLLRPAWHHIFVGMIATLLTAWILNSLRISILALGIVFSEHWPIDVMQVPWHDLVGLITLGLGALPLWIWTVWHLRHPVSGSSCSYKKQSFHQSIPIKSSHSIYSTPSQFIFFATGFILLALLIITLPARPLDVTATLPPPWLPHLLLNQVGQPIDLTTSEQRYFTRYGGAAIRRQYGPVQLLVVQTTAPLRHLHAPDECLTGLGHRVRYVGRISQVATAVYQSVDLQGRRWRVAVTFRSQSGQVASSIAEVAWHWFRQRDTWSMIQRITPWELPDAQHAALEQAVAAMFDIPLLSIHLTRTFL